MPNRDLSDSAITSDVIAALGASPDVHAVELSIDTVERVVRLVGVVDTLEARNTAGELAAGVPGVRAVENDLTVSADRDLSDLQLERAANDALVESGLEEIGARVEAGNAFLMGKVPSASVQEEATDTVSCVRGVRDVISELDIAAGEPVDNLKLADDVAEALSDDPRLYLYDLDVKADDGDVTIRGQVETGKALETAKNVAESIPGVKRVLNRMTVIGT